MDKKNRMQMARERAGFANEAKAAKKIGCSRPLVIAWEKGEADVTKSGYAYAAAVAYKVRPEWIRDPREPDGFPWSPDATPVAVIEPPTQEQPSDVGQALEALARSQAYIAQALAATMPTAAREVLASLDHRLPPALREVGYIGMLRTAIVVQLADNDKLATHAQSEKAHRKPRRKRS